MTPTKKYTLTALALAGACSALFCLRSPQTRAQTAAEPGLPTEGATVDPGVVPGVSAGSSGAGFSGGGSLGSPGSTGGSADAKPDKVKKDVSSSVEGNPPVASGTGDDTTVSSPINTEHHVWTREEMLLASPMPMSGDERQFVFNHKAPESIRSWTLPDFASYIDNPIGAQNMLGEGQRWITTRQTLRVQQLIGQDFIKGKYKARHPGANGDSQQDPQREPDFEFLKDLKTIQTADKSQLFEQLKTCRQDIADLCKSLDEIDKTAKRRGKMSLLEQAYQDGQ